MRVSNIANINDMDGLTLGSNPPLVNGQDRNHDWIQRLIIDNPIIILSKKECFISHAMRRLLTAVGAQPSVIELDESESELGSVLPVLFVGGVKIGGLDGLVGLHLTGELVPKLVHAGAIQSF
ncbi:hypothetical protein LUZ60_012326 [Juncus effusus]|nr:hypothetical protein LUZ60_012326 [Juncus effusus]